MALIKFLFFPGSKISASSGSAQKKSWVSVGMKIIVGVGLVTNCCIVLLIYVNYQAFSQVTAQTNALLQASDGMHTDLRNNIFELQKKYLEIPKLLEVNAGQKILAWIKENFTIAKEEKITGRDNYRQFYNRRQRRDISKGLVVVQEKEGQILVSRGILDENKVFMDVVHHIWLLSDTLAADAAAIQEYILAVVQKASSADALQTLVLQLNSRLADEAIAAETTRNAILYNVESLEKKKAALSALQKEKKQTVVFIALAAILTNLVLLHFMVWFIVERPLKKLTLSLDRINNGEGITVPYLKRRDRIGVLASAVHTFQSVLTRLKKEDQRKKKERRVIGDLVKDMSGMIAEIRQKADAMKGSAGELHAVAENTKNQTSSVHTSALRTVAQTADVANAARQLQSAVESISEQVSNQTGLVTDINSVTHASRKDMDHLRRASEDINEIVNIVKHISRETKLLALNARIEAARAGTAGKGFAVVAREVRELSLQTEAANQDIGMKIDSIQGACQALIANTRRIESRVGNLTETSHQIFSAVEEQRTGIADIAGNAHATTSEIKNVSSLICGVESAAQTTSQFAGAVEMHSEQIEAHLSLVLAEIQDQLSGLGFLDVEYPPMQSKKKISHETKKLAAA